MLEKLTAEQEAKIPEYFQKWLKIGLDCNPADRPQTEAIIRDLFASRDLKKPEKFNWILSPIQKKDQYICYGQHEAGWLSFYDFFINECHLKMGKPILHLLELAKIAGWWYIINENEITCVDRCEHVLFDAQKRAHSPKEAAIKYRDGWGVYCWHGTAIDKDWILKPEESINPLKETNQELRRIGFEILGWDRAMSKIPHEVIQADDFGQLIRTKQSLNDGDQFALFVKVQDPSTDRQYLLRVPPTVKTAKEAVGATFGLKEDEYDPIKET